MGRLFLVLIVIPIASMFLDGGSGRGAVGIFFLTSMATPPPSVGRLSVKDLYAENLAV